MSASYFDNTGAAGAVNPQKVNANINSTVGGQKAEEWKAFQDLFKNGSTGDSYYYNFDPQEIANSILSALNLSDPTSYMQSAWDIANLNSMTSQALAREQMAYQTQSNATAMDFSASEAQKTRDWQTMMSNTAHQREVKDLINAGLNPILSANQGAVVGSAANAQGFASAGAMGHVDTSAVNAIVNAYTQLKQLELADKNINAQYSLQEKSLEAQMKMNEINNQTNKYMADTSAGASMYSAGLNSSAMRYGSELSSSASRFATMINEELVKGGYYNNYAAFFDWLMGMAGVEDSNNGSKSIDLTKPSEQSYENPMYSYKKIDADSIFKGIVDLFKYDPIPKRLAE